MAASTPLRFVVPHPSRPGSVAARLAGSHAWVAAPACHRAGNGLFVRRVRQGEADGPGSRAKAHLACAGSSRPRDGRRAAMAGCLAPAMPFRRPGRARLVAAGGKTSGSP